VNAVGSGAIGALAAIGLHDSARLLLVSGLLGGFTTFSAFSLETAQLWQPGRVLRRGEPRFRLRGFAAGQELAARGAE
jgi:fluoride ion exporter CrcB/FEX